MCVPSFSFISGVSGTSLFNSVSLMAYNVLYTSVPVLVSVLDKDLSEETVMQHPQILFYCQAGRFDLITACIYPVVSSLSEINSDLGCALCSQASEPDYICWMVWAITLPCKFLVRHSLFGSFRVSSPVRR